MTRRRPPPRPPRDPGPTVREGGVDALWLVFAIAVAVIMVAIVVGYYAVTDTWNAHDRCVAQGYPNLLYDVNTPICQRRVNGTDELVPLHSLEKEFDR